MWIKRITLGVSLALCTLLLQAPASAESVTCKEYLREDMVRHNDGSTGNDEWVIKYVVGFKYCNNTDGRDWIKPKYSIGMYNHEGTRMNCNPVTGFNVLRYVEYNPYMWDYSGRNFNPPPFRARCDVSTIGSAFQRYDKAPRLYVIDKNLPRWKANWRIEKTGVFFQGDGTLSGNFKPCNGRANYCY